MFRSKTIAAIATVACVFTAQQGSAGNAEIIAASPTLMVLPLAALAPIAVSASASAQAPAFDYDSPARQIVFPLLEEQKRILVASAARLSNPMQPIIGAFR